ncbi:MAG TPA: anti-sigma factor [Acetobacteraceae bacterium]|nr:anti-sigma factor [Acetobacteraceae bacterium]
MSDLPDDPDLLAAEYVLGTFDPATARQVAARAEADPALRQAIMAWEERLHPLSAIADEAVPPDALWRRLGASIGAGPPIDSGAWFAPASVAVRAWRSLAVWRGATAAGLALAAGLAAFILLRPPPPLPVAALLPSGSGAPAYMAQMQPDGTLRVIALRAVAVADDKDLELWALPKGASAPIPLGVLPARGRGVVSQNVPANGTRLLISLEQKGGSPTGRPQGPVLFAGTLHDVD